jgi:hypothetical protein
MVAYLRENYPDDFNDYIESSEYVALIRSYCLHSTVTFFQSGSKCSRKFLRDCRKKKFSILRLARLINYNAKRNTPATGLLKFIRFLPQKMLQIHQAPSLANVTVVWNDATNANYREQFINILNAANVSGQTLANHRESDTIGGIKTEIYTANSNNTDLPIFTFRRSVSGIDRTI